MANAKRMLFRLKPQATLWVRLKLEATLGVTVLTASGFRRHKTDEGIEALLYRKADALVESMTYGEMPGRMCENCTLRSQFCS